MKKKIFMYYFAYGSNMFTYWLEKRVGKVRKIGIGKLNRHQFRFNKISTDGSLKADSYFTNEDSDIVFGVVFEIDTVQKTKLDKIEGLGKGYDQKEIELELPDSSTKLKAFTYIASKISSDDNLPYDWYTSIILAGAAEHQLPEVYQKSIMSHPTKEDEHTGRRDTSLFIIKESKAIKKHLVASLNLIFELNKSKEVRIVLPNHVLDGRKLFIEKSPKKFNFQTDSPITKGVQRHKELQLGNQKIVLQENHDDSLIIEGKNFLINNIDYDFDNKLKLLSGSIQSLRKATGDSSINRYLRLIIPVDRKLRLINDYQSIGYVTNYRLNPGLVKIEIQAKEYHLFESKFGDQNYLIIDSMEKSSIKDFQHICQIILLSYSFLSGDYHSNEGYFLEFENNDHDKPSAILYHSFSNSIFDLNAAFTTNPYIGLEIENLKRDEKGFIDEKTREELYKDITLFPWTVFNNVCNIAFQNEKIFRALLLLTYNEKSTLEMKIPVQFVAIEALTGAFLQKGNKDLKPIEDNSLAGELISLLISQATTFLEKNNVQIKGNELLNPFFKRLNNLNSPTNSDKLSKPFSEIEYELSEDEKKIIKLRDTFLHGSIKSYGALEEDFKELFYISLKLHFFISLLLLKKAGFSGRIINYAKLYEHITEKYLDEEILKKI